MRTKEPKTTELKGTRSYLRIKRDERGYYRVVQVTVDPTGQAPKTELVLSKAMSHSAACFEAGRALLAEHAEE